MLADFRKLVDSLVRDESERLRLPDKETAIGLAVAQYGRHRPRSKVEDVVATGGDTLPLPTSWAGESELISAECPIGIQPTAYLACSIYTTPSGDVLRLGDAVLAGTEVRLTFSVPHALSDAVDTIRLGDREAVAAWAAALLLEQLSAAAINDGDSTIQADTTDRRTKAQEYAARARALKARYAEALGLNDGDAGTGQPAAGATTAWPARRRLTQGIYRNG